jgi:hypothetical protein
MLFFTQISEVAKKTPVFPPLDPHSLKGRPALNLRNLSSPLALINIFGKTHPILQILTLESPIAMLFFSGFNQKSAICHTIIH